MVDGAMVLDKAKAGNNARRIRASTASNIASFGLRTGTADSCAALLIALPKAEQVNKIPSEPIRTA